MYYLQFGTPIDYIESALRVTFGEDNTIDDVKYLVDNLCTIVKELRG